MKLTKRAKIISAVAAFALLSGGSVTAYTIHAQDVKAKEIKAIQVAKIKAADEKEAKTVTTLKDDLSKISDRKGFEDLKVKASKIKDPARKTILNQAIKSADDRLTKVEADNKAKAEAAKKAEEARKAAEAQAAKEAQEKAAREQAAQEQAAREAEDAKKAQAAQAAQASQQSSQAPTQQNTDQQSLVGTSAQAIAPQTPTHSISGYSTVDIANSQAFIDGSRYSWISISDVPTSGGIALLGHADAAGAWVSSANIGDYVVVSGTRYQIYNKYIVGWNSAGEWDAINSCASGEVSIITCTDASGQSDYVLRARVA